MSRTRKTTKHFQRVIIIVDADKASNTRNKYLDKGYRIKCSGPKITKWPKCDPKRIKFVFEKEMNLKEWREMLIGL